MRLGCAYYYHKPSIAAMVPGAGIEPARLAARDFESLEVFIFHAVYSPVLGAKNHRLKAFFYSYGN